MKKSTIVLTGLLTLLAGCSTKVEQPLPAVIFETDMGNDIDDALALDMLFKYQDDGQIQLLAEGVNKNSPYSTAYIHLLNHWYGYPDTPVGRVVDGIDSNHDHGNYAEEVSLMTDADSLPLYRRPAFTNDSLPETVSLYRRMLAAQPDRSVTLISVGFSTNLARLLRTEADEYSPYNGLELVQHKVRLLSIMAGSFGPYPLMEYNVVKDIPAAQTVARDWPTPIVFTPFEAGEAVKLPSATISEGLSWASHHPVADAYVRYQPMPYDTPLWDVLAVLYAIEPSEEYFTLSPWGNVLVTNDGFTHFTPHLGGTRAYLSLTEEQAQAALRRIQQLLTRPAKR